MLVRDFKYVFVFWGVKEVEWSKLSKDWFLLLVRLVFFGGGVFVGVLCGGVGGGIVVFFCLMDIEKELLFVIVFVNFKVIVKRFVEWLCLFIYRKVSIYIYMYGDVEYIF